MCGKSSGCVKTHLQFQVSELEPHAHLCTWMMIRMVEKHGKYTASNHRLEDHYAV